MRACWLTIGCAVAVACVHPAPPQPVLGFTFEARPTAGEVRVVPALQLHAPIEPVLGSFVGGALPAGQAATRVARARQLQQLTGAVGLALPGEVNGELGERWAAQFHQGSFPLGARARVEEALRSGHQVDLVLGEAARAIGGDAVLISWIDQLEARPLTLDDLPGALVETPAGPVVVDVADEPFLVSARVGVALVAGDGEVVLRYHDTYETVLSGARGPELAGRDLAHALAAEVATVWALDPRLWEAEPPRRSGGAARAGRPEQLLPVVPGPMSLR